MQIAPAFDPLWVPVLTHYDSAPTPGLDWQRTIDHLRHLSPHVTQYLIAGTTGAGWKMSDAVLTDWLKLTGKSDILSSSHKFLVGAFGETTDAVIERARMIEDHLGLYPPVATYAGLTVCPPVHSDAEQTMITRHFKEILGATKSPIAIYQLPQITGCEIAPETFADLAETYPRITLFKDTSGADTVAKARLDYGSVCLVRGAEGDYLEHLKPTGPYDGWLLSTANVFPAQIRGIADMAAGGNRADAKLKSDRLTKLVGELFELAQKVEIGNAFSNANRAVDHILAYGEAWLKNPLPRITSGEALPMDFLNQVEDLLKRNDLYTSTGYRP